MKPDLILLKDIYAICRYRTDYEIQDSIYYSDFYSLTKTKDELSVVCLQNDSIKDFSEISKDWRIFKVSGPLDLSLTGIIAAISVILNENEIPIFTISTFDTDYFLVRSVDLERAVNSLTAGGYEVIYGS